MLLGEAVATHHTQMLNIEGTKWKAQRGSLLRTYFLKDIKSRYSVDTLPEAAGAAARVAIAVAAAAAERGEPTAVRAVGPLAAVAATAAAATLAATAAGSSTISLCSPPCFVIVSPVIPPMSLKCFQRRKAKNPLFKRDQDVRRRSFASAVDFNGVKEL